MHPLRPWLILLILLAPAAGAAPTDPKIEAYCTALARELGVQVSDAVQSIDGTHRRLLATRSYVRAGSGRVGRWSWTSHEIERYEHSAEYRAMMAEVAKVREEFEQRNPGYSLYANTQVRSLDVQLQRWNNNRTVARIADEFLNAARGHFAAMRYPEAPDPSSLDRFVKFVGGWIPSASIPLAAPGMSLHGQARAIDFQVRKDQRIIASTDTAIVAGVWDGQGWTRKLQQAVQSSGAKFTGPLLAPREPWHYEYRP